MKKMIICSFLAMLFSVGAFAQFPTPNNDKSAKRIICYEKDLPTGIAGNNAISCLTVVNPVCEFIDIKAGAEETIYRVEIYNYAGSLLLAENTYENSLLIPADALESGIYLLKIYMASGAVTKRILKS